MTRLFTQTVLGAIAASAILLTTPASAQVVLINDSFTDGNITANNPPGSVPWNSQTGFASVADPSPGTVVSYSNTSIPGGDGHYMRINAGASGQGGYALIPGGPLTLGSVGDYITLSFRIYSPDISASNLSAGFRYGIYQWSSGALDDNGYFAQSPSRAAGGGAGSNLAIGYDNDAGVTMDGGTQSPSATTTGTNAFAANQWWTFSMTLTRDPSDVLRFQATTTNGTVTNTTTLGSHSATNFEFGSVWMTSGQTANFYIENVSVTSSIPEPSTFGFVAAAGILALIARRRRKVQVG